MPYMVTFTINKNPSHVNASIYHTYMDPSWDSVTYWNIGLSLSRPHDIPYDHVWWKKKPDIHLRRFLHFRSIALKPFFIASRQKNKGWLPIPVVAIEDKLIMKTLHTMNTYCQKSHKQRTCVVGYIPWNQSKSYFFFKQKNIVVGYIPHRIRMYGIYANKTGVFVDGQCDTINIAYIHGSVMGTMRPTGWCFGTSIFYFPRNLGLRLSSQLTNSLHHFSEGFKPKHQPDIYD